MIAKVVILGNSSSVSFGHHLSGQMKVPLSLEHPYILPSRHWTFQAVFKNRCFFRLLVSNSTICIISNLHCTVILNNNFNDDISVNAKDNDNKNNDIIVIHVIIKSERRLYEWTVTLQVMHEEVSRTIVINIGTVFRSNVVNILATSTQEFLFEAWYELKLQYWKWEHECWKCRFQS